MTYTKSIYIFHRSLRLDDNLGLIKALEESNEVIPIFIFTPEQIGDSNKFRSNNAIIFMISSLLDVNADLKKKGSKLFLFNGKQQDVLDKLLRSDDDIEAVYVNEEYTKYGVEREKALEKVCGSYEVDFFSVQDYLLHKPDTAQTGSGEFYSKFTPFYRNIIKNNVDKPRQNRFSNYISSKYKQRGEIEIVRIHKLFEKHDNSVLLKFPASRKEGKQRLTNIKKHKQYANFRNDLPKDTTRLSPYIKFGNVSIREVYHKIKDLYGKTHDLIKQLYWREFYYVIAYNRPDIFQSKSFKKAYDKIKWMNSQTLFNKWKQGITGFPIVDAGMRELVQTGYMHNRARLITSNFLIKLLGVDWRKGEQFYATKLLDYDPSVNNGNWQWSAGSGADSQPYFRIFNPWTQGKKFDPDCDYIKKWIPELVEVDESDIHDWENAYADYKVDYPKPCIDYNKARKDIKKTYSKIY